MVTITITRSDTNQVATIETSGDRLPYLALIELLDEPNLWSDELAAVDDGPVDDGPVDDVPTRELGIDLGAPKLLVKPGWPARDGIIGDLHTPPGQDAAKRANVINEALK